MVRRGSLNLVILGIAGVGLGLWQIGSGLKSVWLGHWFAASGEGVGTLVFGAYFAVAGLACFKRGLDLLSGKAPSVDN